MGFGLFGDDEVRDGAQEGEVAGEGGDGGQEVPGVGGVAGEAGRGEGDAGFEEEDGGDVGDEVGQQQGNGGEGEGVVEGDVGLDVGHGAGEEIMLLDVADDDEEADEEEDEFPIDEGEEFAGVLSAGDEHEAGGDEGGDFARDGGEEEAGDQAGGDEEGFGDVPGTSGILSLESWVLRSDIGLRTQDSRFKTEQVATVDEGDGEDVEDEAGEDEGGVHEGEVGEVEVGGLADEHVLGVADEGGGGADVGTGGQCDEVGDGVFAGFLKGDGEDGREGEADDVVGEDGREEGGGGDDADEEGPGFVSVVEDELDDFCVEAGDAEAGGEQHQREKEGEGGPVDEVAGGGSEIEAVEGDDGDGPKQGDGGTGEAGEWDGAHGNAEVHDAEDQVIPEVGRRWDGRGHKGEYDAARGVWGQVRGFLILDLNGGDKIGVALQEVCGADTVGIQHDFGGWVFRGGQRRYWVDASAPSGGG